MSDQTKQAFEARIKTLGDEQRRLCEHAESKHHYTLTERARMRQKARVKGWIAQEIRKVLDAA